MTAPLVATVLIAYFLVLILIAFLTSRNADSSTFFTGNKQSPWYLVAFGMIGASLSGVTFISVPGKVLTESMAYFQIVLGYVIGYLIIILSLKVFTEFIKFTFSAFNSKCPFALIDCGHLSGSFSQIAQ